MVHTLKRSASITSISPELMAKKSRVASTLNKSASVPAMSISTSPVFPVQVKHIKHPVQGTNREVRIETIHRIATQKTRSVLGGLNNINPRRLTFEEDN